MKPSCRPDQEGRRAVGRRAGAPQGDRQLQRGLAEVGRRRRGRRRSRRDGGREGCQGLRAAPDEGREVSGSRRAGGAASCRAPSRASRSAPVVGDVHRVVRAPPSGPRRASPHPPTPAGRASRGACAPRRRVVDPGVLVEVHLHEDAARRGPPPSPARARSAPARPPARARRGPGCPRGRAAGSRGSPCAPRRTACRCRGSGSIPSRGGARGCRADCPGPGGTRAGRSGSSRRIEAGGYQAGFTCFWITLKVPIGVSPALRPDAHREGRDRPGRPRER